MCHDKNIFFYASTSFTCLLVYLSTRLLVNLFNIVVCTDSLKETCIDVIEGV